MQKNEVILISPGPTGFLLRNTLAASMSRGPRRLETPLNVLSLASVLKRAEYEVKLIDGSTDNIPRKLKECINDKTLFVGISSLTGYQIVFGIKAAGIVKRIAPDMPIIWGGLHPSVLPEETLQSRYVDMVCRGEGDITVVELARAMQKNLSLRNIKGISYKENGSIINNPPRELINMDELYTDYSLLNRANYDFSYLSYQSSRGCPHRCRFCEVGPVHGRKYRIRSIQKVVDDIEELVRTHNAKEINLIDENFFVNLNRAKEFADTLLRRKLNIRWRAMSRADYFRRTDLDFWKLMKEAGCRIILIGAESGSQKVLNDIRKDCTVEDIKNSASQLSKAKLAASIGFMCGLPNEGMDDMKMTMDLIDKITPLHKITINGIFLLSPLPMTDYYTIAKQRGTVFPDSLKSWSVFLWGSKRYLKWHPHKEFAFRLSIVSKWLVKPILANFSRAIKRMDIFMFLVYLCGLSCHYRWKHKFFAFPVDIYLLYIINKYIFKYMWWK